VSVPGSEYRLTEVTSSGSADFADAYGALDAEFGPRGELERREVIARWLDGPTPETELRRRYHLLVARDPHGAFAGARDGHVFVDRSGERPVALVYLAHSFVVPRYRRTGLGARFRSEPIALAHRALDDSGIARSAADLVLAAEMEPAVAEDPASYVRLAAYAKDGFAAIAPAALPYCQPDFRDLDALSRETPRPLPLLAIVRWVGHEGAASLPKKLARAFVAHLYAAFATHVRADRLAALSARTLGVLDAFPSDEVPLLPLPRTTDDHAAVAPLSRDAVLASFPPELR
jgi:GNAT superfamily N-acetyltransferase